MKYFLTVIGLLIFALSPARAQTTISELNPEQYYDFWVGEWDLTWKTKSGTTGQGENSISKTLNDKVIEENFKVIDDENISDYKGKSWSVYNSLSKTWYQTWVDNQGAYLAFTGEISGDKRIFIRKLAKADGNMVMQRMVFYDIKQDSFTWDWENSTDMGKTWNLLWRISYKRKK